MKLALATMLLVSAFLGGCGSKQASSISDIDVTVLRAALSGSCSRADSKYWVFSTTPATEDEWRTPEAWEKSAAFDAELLRRSAVSTAWSKIDVCSTIKVIDGQKLDSMFASDDRVPPGWDEFYRTFPDAAGIIQLSLPAFAADGNRAVVSWRVVAI